ncbi:unnamed protein product [Pseudo-nitzschia multistriata]|uniref:Uncharacterized protein n=1 Tax=Pseudo-nitzschia multistriata TaxID=183589 RepID=A0A448YU81_9STRA|nr:unnamed protein product [Pseudo-nitzschia multistriata]
MKARRSLLMTNVRSVARNGFISPSLLLCSVLVLLTTRGTNFGDKESCSMSSAVVAFQVSSFASPSVRAPTTKRIRSDLFSHDDKQDALRSIQIDSTKKPRQLNTAPPQRRMFLQQAGLAATAFAAGLSQLDTVEVVNALDMDSKNAAAASAMSGIKVSKNVGGLAQRIRGGLCFKMDELQRDLMQERWDLLPPYPAQLRSYVTVFTTYTDAAFPSDSPSDYGLRVALRYEVGRFFASVERLKRAIAKQSLEEAYTAYADMSLHLDRYLRVGGLYTYYDSVVDNEVLFKEYNDALVYSDPSKDPAEVRDLVVLCNGPDKGKTGILIGIYPPTEKASNVVVKLDKYRGMREIRVVPRLWAAKRLGEQDPDAVFLIPRK